MTKRTRLSPEARREQLLDVAKENILQGGLQQFSLKNLAVVAGVSEPLLFHYFTSRTELLQQLLQREFDRSTNSLNNALEGVDSLDEILRIYVEENYDGHNEENVIKILLAEPDIAIAVKEKQESNFNERGQELVNIFASTLGIRRRKAAMLALMSSAASLSAAKFARESKIDREEATETAIEFIKAGFGSQDTN